VKIEQFLQVQNQLRFCFQNFGRRGFVVQELDKIVECA
jgi:hypothetical protein